MGQKITSIGNSRQDVGNYERDSNLEVLVFPGHYAKPFHIKVKSVPHDSSYILYNSIYI